MVKVHRRQLSAELKRLATKMRYLLAVVLSASGNVIVAAEPTAPLQFYAMDPGYFIALSLESSGQAQWIAGYRRNVNSVDSPKTLTSTLSVDLGRWSPCNEADAPIESATPDDRRCVTIRLSPSEEDSAATCFMYDGYSLELCTEGGTGLRLWRIKIDRGVQLPR